SLFALQREITAQALDHPMHHGQAEPRARLLRREEGGENLVSHVGWNTTSLVLHVQKNGVVSLGRTRHRDPASFARSLGGVEQEVPHHLAHLILVRERPAGLEAALDPKAACR